MQGKKSMLKAIAGGMALVALATPAVAAQYWVVKSPSTKKCDVVQQKPATPAFGHAFDTPAAALSAIAGAATCRGAG